MINLDCEIMTLELQLYIKKIAKSDLSTREKIVANQLVLFYMAYGRLPTIVDINQMVGLSLKNISTALKSIKKINLF